MNQPVKLAWLGQTVSMAGKNGLPSNLWMLSSLLIGFSVVERVRILPVWWYEEGFGDGVGT